NSVGHGHGVGIGARSAHLPRQRLPPSGARSTRARRGLGSSPRDRRRARRRPAVRLLRRAARQCALVEHRGRFRAPKENPTMKTTTIVRVCAAMLLPLSLAAQVTPVLTPAASAPASPDTTRPKVPFAFANFGWLNGNSRQDSSVLDTKYF